MHLQLIDGLVLTAMLIAGVALVVVAVGLINELYNLERWRWQKRRDDWKRYLRGRRP